MSIDRAEWHQGDDLPADLDPAAAGTHIGMFLAWAVLRDLTSAAHETAHADALAAVRARAAQTTPGRYLAAQCGGSLADDDLAEEAQQFAREYYISADAATGRDGQDDENNNGDDDVVVVGSGVYLDDYERTLAAGLPSLYHVHDSWDNYDLLAPVLDAAFEAWRERG
ncbi:hypothetical protein IF1G_11293 [Cordyceps javanica]|uniref:DUF7832 domain-containing protein n=1 Tax=Cordyceps javanica TaxID=43265 RepID=A0A545VKC3_9HYPO|nr:hypothetical protein IF1G_11293 [Cordyceps javanica]TQW02181.1 cupin domain-containing protein [Cordyceps javanica]